MHVGRALLTTKQQREKKIVISLEMKSIRLQLPALLPLSLNIFFVAEILCMGALKKKKREKKIEMHAKNASVFVVALGDMRHGFMDIELS